MSSSKSPFSPALFDVLKELSENNNRQWFNANKERYHSDVRDPMLQFIVMMQAPLAELSAHIVASPKPVGGSMFRIYRDTRFSKDKTPYKTHAAAHFQHSSSGDAHSLGFYVHLGPEKSLLGCGVWRPATPSAYQIRNHIAAHPEDWRKATTGQAFLSPTNGVEGEQLKRVPKEFGLDHPFADDLRRKDFTASARLSSREVTSPGFVEQAAGNYRAMAPLAAYLARALELAW